MVYKENIEKIFLDEVRDKKRTGTGSFHRKGKGVKNGMKGALKTPFTYMKEKERKKLSGEVETYNMNTIINYQEFEAKDKETQKMLLTHWREIFSNKEIMSGLAVSSSFLNKLIARLDVPVKARGGSRPRTGTRTGKPKILPTAAEPVKIIQKGMHLEFSGIYGNEELSQILTKLQFLTEGPSTEFEIQISFQEKNKSR
jgi:hypothetical protein